MPFFCLARHIVKGNRMFFKGMKNKAYSAGYRAGHGAGYAEGEVTARKRREECQLIELRAMVGAPVICLPNEWDNPIIGFGNRIEFIANASQPILMVDDCIRGTERTSFGGWFLFSEQKLHALAKLDPYERWVVHSKYATGHELYDKPRIADALMGEALVSKVMESPFWAKWLEFHG